MAREGPPIDTTTRDARTLAVVVSDIVGSTALRTKMGEGAFTTLREAHDGLAADLVEECGGRVVRFTGDGLLVAFPSAGQALEYASMLAPGVEELGDEQGRLAVRVGIALGDAIDVNGDLDGPALVEASRLCDAADPGQVLCTESVRRASRSDDRDFGDAAVVPLKGLGDVDVRELLRRVTVRAPARLAISVLGPLRVARGGRALDVGGTKEQRVLAVLAAARGRVVLMDELVEALWDRAPPRTAERSVQAYVARLRKAIVPSRQRGAPPRVILTEGKGYRLAVEDDTLDNMRFERLARSARESIAAGHALRARQALDDAISLWHGTPFQEHLDAERCAREARRLEDLHELAIEDLTSARLGLGDAADLVPDLEALVALHPLREQLWANLMLALYRAGRQAEALRTFQRARAILVDELGIDPGAELHHLESRILAQDPTLLTAAPGTPGAIRRLPTALDHGGTRLVGRDEELARLHAAWERAFAGTGEFVAIVGREGMGKTRLVSELAVQVSDEGAIVLYACCDAADKNPEALLDRALHGAGAQFSDVVVEAGETRGAALARFLSLWGGGRPVLVVLDDVQLADTATVENLADLAEWSASAPMLVVALFRPEDNDVGDTGRGRIALSPLEREWVLEIARGYRSRWTDRDIDELVDASGGVPLAVHRYASEWAQEATRREVHAAAERASEARVRLVASRGELADGIEGLQRLIEHRQLQLASRPAATSLRVPFRGLEPFGSEDADLFFGREQLVGEMVARLASAPLVVVVGASGSGKSSLIRAGLLPALDTGVVWDAGTWSASVTVPGRDPLRVLDSIRAVPDAHEQRVLVVDQLEELWTACADPDVHNEFCDHLVALSRHERVTLVLCIRADFVDRIADHAELAALVGANTLLVPPMTPDELHRVVEGPARRTGLDVEPQLVEAVVADVHGRPGALPFLSTALLATWERRETRTLTLRCYRAAGGVASAVAAVADGCYAALAPGAQVAARRLLLQLAGEEHGVDVRRRVPIIAIGADDPDTRQALDALVARRLVILDGDVAEVTHEALLRGWPRLAGWLDEDRSGRQLRQRLSAAATSWVESDRDGSELYRGTRLDGAVEWADAHPAEINSVERDFLIAARARQDSELRTARRTARRFRRLTVALGLFLVVALIAAGVAVDQRQIARDESTRTRARQLAAASRSLLGNELVVPLLLAEESFRLDPSSAGTRGALQASVSSSSGLERLLPFGSAARSVVSGNGRVLATASANGAVHLYDLAHDRPMGTLSAPTSSSHDPVQSVLLSPDGRRAGVAFGKRVELWDVATRRRVGGFRTSRNADGYMADAETVFTADEAGVVERWDVEDPAHPRRSEVATGAASPAAFPPFVIARLDLHLLAVSYDYAELHLYHVPDAGPADELAAVPGGAAAFSPDGTRLAVSELANTAIYDLSDASRPAQLLQRVPTPAWDPKLPFSPPLWAPDASWVAVGSFQGTVSVLNAADLRPWRDPLDVHGDYAYPVGALDHGRRIVTSLERQLGIWKLATRAPLAQQLAGHTDVPGAGLSSALASLVTSPTFLGNERLATVGTGDDTAIVHDLRTGRVRRWLPAAYGALSGVALSADRRRVATVNTDRHVAVWDRARGTKLGDVLGPNLAASPSDAIFVSLSPDGRRLATGRSTDGTVRLWDVDAGRFIGDPIRVAEPGAYPPVIAPAFSPDSRKVAIAAATSNTILIVDAATGRVTRRITDTRVGGFTANAWSPDGGRIAAAGNSGVLDLTSVWDTATGERLGSVSGHEIAPFGVAFSPDGQTFATNSNQTILWDATSFAAIGPPLDVADAGFDFGYTVAFSPDGKRLAAAYGHGKLAVWDVDPESWARRACAIAGRNLTQAEWSQYLPGLSYHRTCAQWPAGA